MGLRKLKLQNWLRRQKLKYMYRNGGPRASDKDTALYFDWRRLKIKPRQDHGNVHPGTKFWE
jgi:hypothetical protein